MLGMKANEPRIGIYFPSNVWMRIRDQLMSTYLLVRIMNMVPNTQKCEWEQFQLMGSKSSADLVDNITRDGILIKISVGG
uniref:Uncharacterized protein n=1 Tax=Octopus bimaculoides TaxID=37653 RepID=A0A0L8GGA4_OCTBM